ncbi:Histidine decarboxylase proenzyme precursor [Clostridium perfringens]|nr:Histidine decarboxylase proenzyme precursor [Clostridium perfringens]
MNKNLEANRNRTLSEGIHKNIKVRAPKMIKQL